MNRRMMFGMVGASGAGLVLGGPSRGLGQGGAERHEATPGPMGAAHSHFCGIHIAKANPKFQLVTQHYCAAHGGEGGEDDLFQCVLYDSTGANAKLLGVEYIITDAAYRRLPDEEKRYWHPHSYEVLGGGLIAPGMEAGEERTFMEGLLTTWGKAWHTWPDPTTAVPIGEPLLIWSLTGDGQADESVVADRDREFGISTEAIRERRCRELGLEVPQVPSPSSMDQIGRQWTEEGEDRPTRRR